VRSGARILVTGASGCIGAWVVRQLAAEGAPVVAFDRSDDRRRLRLLLPDETVASIPWVQGDITQDGALESAIDDHEVSSVIHLAALQVPFCRADPVLGARVNVEGTVRVFEAVRRRADRMGPVVYASSVAAYDAIDDVRPPTQPGAPPASLLTTAASPSTLYGVYKRANEGTAQVFWSEHHVASLGLRPHTVYGPGRDQGVTSAPTAAMLAAAAGQPYTIPFAGRLTLQHAAEAAAAFVAAARTELAGAHVVDLPGHVCATSEIVELIERARPEARGTIQVTGEPLGFPAEVAGGALEGLVGPLPVVPLEDGVRDTVERFEQLLASGAVAPGTA
jgi:UDP-glucuronate 4-epimerase